MLLHDAKKNDVLKQAFFQKILHNTGTYNINVDLLLSF